MFARFVVMVSTILVLISGLNAGDVKKDEKDKLQGEWTVVSVEVSGKKLDEDNVKKLKPLIIKGGEWTAPGGGKFTYKNDPTKTPKHLDLMREERGGMVATWQGIYKIEDSTLTFCRPLGDNVERPREFKAGDGVILFVFKRSSK
jgi:uncharacterized protein (TIGR03067 family)